jgi:hypothetical protein
MGVAGTSFLLSPTNSLLQTALGTIASPTTNLVGVDPLVVSQYDASVTFQAWRTNPNFVGAILVAADLPPYLLGNYHLQSTSPAINAGATSKNGISAPAFDFDNQVRPAFAYDIGADEIIPALPSLTLLDNFNRTNANNLGANWSQTGSGTNVAIRVNNQQAYGNTTGSAIWNVPSGGFGANQGAAFTFANATVNNIALLLKATGGNASAPANFIRVLYNNGLVTVATTTNSGAAYTTRGTLSATFASGNTLSAFTFYNASLNTVYVNVYNGATFLGSVAIATSGSGSWAQGSGVGRIGMQLPSGARVDNCSGGSVP